VYPTGEALTHLTSFIKTRCANRLPVGSRKLLRLSITSW